MKIMSPEEAAKNAQSKERSLESYSEKEKWESMSKLQRARYLWDYYKLPFVIIFIIVYIISFIIYRQVNHKDVALYVGLVNIAPTEETTAQLTDDFLTYEELSPAKNECKLYSNWYLTTDQSSEFYAYTYASQLKILASIDDEQLDVVLMNRESFNAFSQNGYLYDLEKLLQDSPLYEKLAPYLVVNVEILEDNAKDINFDPTIEYQSEAVEYIMGLDMTESFLCKNASYSDTIYLGVLKNTPRVEHVLDFLGYMYQ